MLDKRLLELMLEGFSNSEIARKTARPLSTIQRRTTNLLRSGLIRQKYELDYSKMGYRTGYMHVYVDDGDVRQIAEKVHEVADVESVSIHVGNSDIVAKYVCKASSDLMTLQSSLKHIGGVEKVVWSEEVLLLPSKSSYLHK